MSLSSALRELRNRRLAVRHNGEMLRRRDLVELVLQPIASQIDKARLDILEQIQKLLDSTDIMARQMVRQVKKDE